MSGGPFRDPYVTMLGILCFNLSLDVSPVLFFSYLLLSNLHSGVVLDVQGGL